MAHPVINTDECIGCGICVDTCEQHVLDIVDGVCDAVDEDLCIGCSSCVEECPIGAITIEEE